MSNDPAFQCPACRARQALQDQCRRCGADLKLLARAKRHLTTLVNDLQSAIAQGDTVTAQRCADELKLFQADPKI
jgi:primosomal protein N'